MQIRVPITGVAGSGEANVAVSAGTGVSLVKPKSGVTLPFKSLKEGANVLLTFNDDEITISVLAGALTTVVPPDDTSSAFTVKNAANTENRVKLFGEGIIELGAQSAEFSGFSMTRHTGLHLHSGALGGDVEVLMVANAPTAASEAAYAGWPATQRGPNRQNDIGLVGNDSIGRLRMNYMHTRSVGGLFFWMNVKPDNTVTFPAHDPNRPQTKFGYDSAGTFGWRYKKPDGAAVTGFESTDDFHVIFKVQGLDTNWEVTQYAFLGTKTANRGISFGTSSQIASGDYKAALKIEPWLGGSPGTVEAMGYLIAKLGLRLEGAVDFPASTLAKHSIYWPVGVAPSAQINNSLYYDGTDIWLKDNVGALKKLTP